MSGEDPVDALARLRARLDTVDGELVGALAARQRLVEQVTRLKQAAPGRPLRDADREASLLARIAKLAEGQGLDADFVVRLYQEILDHSVRHQQHRLSPAHPRPQGHTVVAHLGGLGSYSAQAARRHFESHGGGVVFRQGTGFAELVEAVQKGEADCAVLPIENTTAGSIAEVYDLLAASGLHIVGEEVQPIDHCLIGLEPDVAVSRIRRIASHPQALAQCRAFLRRLPGVVVEAVSDTAAAVTRVKADQDLSLGAIASAEAARIHGLHILQTQVADQRENYTRFVVVAAAPRAYDLRIPCKTSLVFTAPHAHGALVKALQIFADHGLNLTKLESRPQPGQPWDYLFYVDFEGNPEIPAVAEALKDLDTVAGAVKILGVYPSRTTVAPATPEAP